jgi:hypothetical protein
LYGTRGTLLPPMRNALMARARGPASRAAETDGLANPARPARLGYTTSQAVGARAPAPHAQSSLVTHRGLGRPGERGRDCEGDGPLGFTEKALT